MHPQALSTQTHPYWPTQQETTAPPAYVRMRDWSLKVWTTTSVAAPICSVTAACQPASELPPSALGAVSLPAAYLHCAAPTIANRFASISVGLLPYRMMDSSCRHVSLAGVGMGRLTDGLQTAYRREQSARWARLLRKAPEAAWRLRNR